jgi:prepilin-type N-terminal cleavage/methylation domain-containing protein
MPDGGRRRLLRRRIDSDDGVTLVELMVAITILAVAMGGFTTSLVSGLLLSSNNNSRAIAANVLDERMSELRARDFKDIPQTRVEETVTRGSRDIEVVQEATLVPQSATSNACDSPDTGTPPAYLRVSLEASWTRMKGVAPVTSNTIINPPVAAYDPYRGHASVMVLDRDGQPRAGVGVHIAPVSDGALVVPPVRQTTADGCVFFANLVPGTYHVWLDEPGNVDRVSLLEDTSAATPPDQVVIAPSTTQTLDFSYDGAATVILTAPGVGALPTWPIPVNLTQPNFVPLNPPSGGTTAPGDPHRVADASTLSTQPLFPFASGWGIWAGCTEHDPEPLSESRLQVATEPGVTTTEEMPLGLVRITVVAEVDDDDDDDDDDGGPQSNEKVRLEGQCDGSDLDLDYVTKTDADGSIEVLAPYGTWKVRVRDEDPEDSWPSVTVTPSSGPIDVTVELDD